MTREEAIDYLTILGGIEGITANEAMALEIAIEALEEEPSYNSVNSLVESKLKNPKAKTFDILHFVADNAGLSTFEAIEKAYNMGVSEQEQALDKIRAEIKGMIPTYHNPDWSITDLVPISEVLKLIDKYMAESREK